jgi:hypothetical protein
MGMFSTAIFALGAGSIGSVVCRNSAMPRWHGKVVGAIYCATRKSG